MDLRFALGLTALTGFLQSHDWVAPELGLWPRLGDLLYSVLSPTVVPSNVVSSGALDSGDEVCEIIPVKVYALRTY